MKLWRVNIFDKCNMVEYDSSCNYIIQQVNNMIQMVCDDIIVINPEEILQQYDIFKSDVIGIDYKTFSCNIREIKRMVLKHYNISYIQKIKNIKNLHYNETADCFQSLDCLIMDEIKRNDYYEMIVEDNLKDMWKIKATFSIYPFHSKFEIIGKYDMVSKEEIMKMFNF